MDVCKAHDVGILAYSPLAQGLLAGKYKDVDSCHDGISRSRLFKAGRSSKCRHHGEGCEAEMFACIDGMRELATKHNLSMVQLAVGWLLAQEAVTSVVFGASKASHIASNVAVATSPLDKTLVEELTQLSEPVKKALGSCPDLVSEARAMHCCCDIPSAHWLEGGAAVVSCCVHTHTYQWDDESVGRYR